MPYAVAHHLTEKPGVFAPRGAMRDLWRSYDFERVLSGPAECGKTYGMCHYLDALLWKFPKAQGVIARKQLTDVHPTVLPTFHRVIGLTPGAPVSSSGVRVFGGNKPEWYDYPNGSRLWVAGLDKPGKALSAERDFVYVNQLEECALADWETLTTRVTGRGAVMPKTYMLGDCNPMDPYHWIKTRPSVRLMEVRHEDNPTLYRSDGSITPQGRRTLAILDALTGVRKQRLRFGRWVKAEGVVYEDWDAAANVIDVMPPGWHRWPKFRSIDFGFNDPAVCQWWSRGPDRALYLYRELYVTGWLAQDLALGKPDPDRPGQFLYPGILTLSEADGGEAAFEATVCDHDLGDRMTLERYGIDTTPAYKEIKEGIDAVAQRIRPDGSGRRRLFVLRSSPLGFDDTLRERRKPTSVIQEIDGYVWEQPKEGKPAKELPVDRDNHGLDSMRYAVAYEDLARFEPGETDDPEYFH